MCFGGGGVDGYKGFYRGANSVKRVVFVYHLLVVCCVSGGGGCVGVSHTIGFDGSGFSRCVGGCEC